MIDVKSRGFSLVELMVAVSILAIIAAIAVPSFNTMILNAKTRTAAEAIVNGLQKARAEAVTRNANIEFILAADVSWIVQTPAAVVLQSRRGDEEGSAEVTLATNANATTATFNSFGSLISNADSSVRLSQIDISITNGSRPLRVVVGAGGSVRMCETKFASGTDARAC
jgi:type IV fimbrial biogenesis protein FimT